MSRLKYNSSYGYIFCQKWIQRGESWEIPPSKFPSWSLLGYSSSNTKLWLFCHPTTLYCSMHLYICILCTIFNNSPRYKNQFIPLHRLTTITTKVQYFFQDQNYFKMDAPLIELWFEYPLTILGTPLPHQWLYAFNYRNTITSVALRPPYITKKEKASDPSL